MGNKITARHINRLELIVWVNFVVAILNLITLFLTRAGAGTT